MVLQASLFKSNILYQLLNKNLSYRVNFKFNNMFIKLFCEKCDDLIERELKNNEEVPKYCKCCEKTIEPEEYEETEQQRITDGIQRGII